MKIDVIKTQTTEVWLETPSTIVTVTQWSNCEGCNLMVTDNNLTIKLAASLRWEDMDVIMTALNAIRCTSI